MPPVEPSHGATAAVTCPQGQHTSPAAGAGRVTAGSGVVSKAGNGGAPAPNKLYFGDNLDWLPKIDAESVDLVYLDPPFNSNANYSVLFRSPVAEDSSAQIQAFEDTWSWGQFRGSGARSCSRTLLRIPSNY